MKFLFTASVVTALCLTACTHSGDNQGTNNPTSVKNEKRLDQDNTPTTQSQAPTAGGSPAATPRNDANGGPGTANNTQTGAGGVK